MSVGRLSCDLIISSIHSHRQKWWWVWVEFRQIWLPSLQWASWPYPAAKPLRMQHHLQQQQQRHQKQRQWTRNKSQFSNELSSILPIQILKRSTNNKHKSGSKSIHLNSWEIDRRKKLKRMKESKLREKFIPIFPKDSVLDFIQLFVVPVLTQLRWTKCPSMYLLKIKNVEKTCAPYHSLPSVCLLYLPTEKIFNNNKNTFIHFQLVDAIVEFLPRGKNVFVVFFLPFRLKENK